jgi:hypothetical protein
LKTLATLATAVEAAAAKQIKNNDHSTQVLQLFDRTCSGQVTTTFQHLLDQHNGHGENQLREVMIHMSATFQPTALELKASISFDMAKIGIASDIFGLRHLLTCIQVSFITFTTGPFYCQPRGRSASSRSRPQ